MNLTSEKQPATTAEHSKQTRQPNLLTKLNQLGFQILGSRLPRLMSWWACRLWSRTRRFSASNREQRMQIRASECSLKVHDKQIQAWVWGEGPTILLVHGWNGRGLQLHRLIDPLLKAGYQVVCFDAPAHGQTAGTHTHLLEICDVILTLEKNLGPFHAAVAHSFGVACLSTAINAGMKVPNIVSISSPGGLSRLIQRYCQYMQIPSPTEKQLRNRLSRRLGDTLWQQFADSYPLTAGVKRSLVIHDKKDWLVSWRESERLAQCWPNAELLLTEGLGHRRILLDLTTVSQIVTFIENSVVYDLLDNDLSHK